MSNSLYERDFCAWASEQAGPPRAGRLTEADVGNIAEEIESIGRSEKRELARDAFADHPDRTAFPADCPYTFDQAVNRKFWPE